MAMFGPLSTLQSQAGKLPELAVGFAYAEEALRRGSVVWRRLQELKPGDSRKVELTGGAFVAEQAYLSKRREEGFFESHRKFIDLQLVVEGRELMEAEDIARLTVSAEFDPERDLIKYADTAQAAVLRMLAGDAAVFYPADGHLPSLAWGEPVLVRKAVVKIPVG